MLNEVIFLNSSCWTELLQFWSIGVLLDNLDGLLADVEADVLGDDTWSHLINCNHWGNWISCDEKGLWINCGAMGLERNEGGFSIEGVWKFASWCFLGVGSGFILKVLVEVEVVMVGWLGKEKVLIEIRLVKDVHGSTYFHYIFVGFNCLYKRIQLQQQDWSLLIRHFFYIGIGKGRDFLKMEVKKKWDFFVRKVEKGSKEVHKIDGDWVGKESVRWMMGNAFIHL